MTRRLLASILAFAALISATSEDAHTANRLSARAGRVAVAGYDLAAKLAALPFVVTQPTAPTLTSTCNASTSGELTTCLGTNGADITITANITGSFTVNGLDQRITINSGVSLNSVDGTSQANARPLTFGTAARRTHIRGPGTIAGAFSTNASAQDIRLDSDLKITTRSDSTTADWDAVQLPGTRVLAEHVTVTSRGYASYSASSIDLVIANSKMYTTLGCETQCNDATIRFVNCTRCVVIDSHLINYSHHTLRAHGGSTNVYWGRNQSQADFDDNFGGGVASYNVGNPDPQCTTCWMVDSSVYGSFVNIPADPVNVAWTITGNRIYTDTGANFTLGCGAGWTCSDNVKGAWGSGPPPFNFP